MSAIPGVLHHIQTTYETKAHHEAGDTAEDADGAVLFVLEVRGEHQNHGEGSGAPEIEEADHEPLHHELRARLRVEEHYLTRLRVGVVPMREAIQFVTSQNIQLGRTYICGVRMMS